MRRSPPVTLGLYDKTRYAVPNGTTVISIIGAAIATAAEKGTGSAESDYSLGVPAGA
jgi:hypothetical protein